LRGQFRDQEENMFVRTHTSTPFGDAFFVVFDRIEVVGKVNVLSTSCPRPGNKPQGIHGRAVGGAVALLPLGIVAPALSLTSCVVYSSWLSVLAPLREILFTALAVRRPRRDEAILGAATVSTYDGFSFCAAPATAFAARSLAIRSALVSGDLTKDQE
jgi:hypothetical protein